MPIRRLLTALLTAALSAPAAFAATPPPPAKLKLPEIKYETYTLPNGLKVITHEDHRLPLVAVDLWYHVGPLNERAGRTGFAHLFEHMMFEGSAPDPPDTPQTNSKTPAKARSPSRNYVLPSCVRV